MDKFEKIYTRDSCKIYIIPNSGCSSCISNAETFALANQKDKEFIFLFTKISSLKLFKNRFSDTFYNSSNVILDSTNLFISPDQNNEIYPMVILKDKINFRIINILNPSK